MTKSRTLNVGCLIALLLIAGYLVASPIVLSRFLLFKATPVDNYDKVPLKVFGVSKQLVSFQTSDKKTLHGLFFEKPGAKLTFLLHHGQGGNLVTHIGSAKTILLAGYSVLIYDYEGFGMSSGTPSIDAMLKDGEAANDFLVNTKRITPDTIVQCGGSLGTGVASHVAMTRKCRGVILVCPYLSINQLAVELFPYFRYYPSSLFPQPELGSQSFIRSNLRTPVLLIHGAKDPLINVHHAQRLNEIAKCSHLLLVDPKAHHGDFSTLVLADEYRKFGHRLIADQN